MKTRLLLLGVVLMTIAVTQPLGATVDTKSVTISATVSAAAKLTVSTATLTFPNSDPDTVPSISATEGGVNITAKARTTGAGSVTLTLLAGTDLTSGGDTIPISNLTWTATGAGFVAGTMNKTTAQSVAAWTGSGSWTGTQTFAMTNSWSYTTGTYSATATYTLTAP
jgi:hypothetical protein